jgi:hypothetical protein
MPGTAAPVVEVVEIQTQCWAFPAAPGQPSYSRRGLYLLEAANVEAIIERVSNAARLDAAMHEQLVRILTITVQDWMRK